MGATFWKVLCEPRAQHRAMQLSGQTAIVRGSSSGIGAAVAKSLAQEGANVVVNYPGGPPEGADETAAAITAIGGAALIIECDVSKEDQVAAMFAKTVSTFGTVDILINNAGWQKDSPFAQMTLAQWQAVMDVNLTGQFLCAREAVREFVRRGMVPERSKALGKIVCMSSVHEVIPWGGHVNYASSKGGIMLMMKSIAQEVAPQKIRVNGIGPGAIRTPINQGAWDTPEALASLLTLIPYGRIGEPEDIGAAAVWLCSDASDYVTGTTLFVDGGMTLYPGFSTNG
jgi:glucose 1-dehydrogenase